MKGREGRRRGKGGREEIGQLKSNEARGSSEALDVAKSGEVRSSESYQSSQAGYQGLQTGVEEL